MTGGSQLVAGWLVAQLLSCGLFSQGLYTCRCFLLGGCWVLRSFALACPMEFAVSAVGKASPSDLGADGSSDPKPVVQRASPSKHRRDLARTTARNRWLESQARSQTEQADDNRQSAASHASALEGWFGELEKAISRVLMAGDNPYSTCLSRCSEQTSQHSTARQRETFPMGFVQTWTFESLAFCTSTLQLVLLNACIAALNFLAMDFHVERCAKAAGKKHNKLQTTVVKHLAARVCLFLRSLKEVADLGSFQGFAPFESKPTGPVSRLDSCSC